jgi:hypothetical protein
LPALTAVTPRCFASADNAMALSSAPRALKVPVYWNNSSFRKTCVPAPAARSIASPRHSHTGVSRTRSPNRSRAARMSSMAG